MKPVKLITNSFSIYDLEAIKQQVNEATRLFYHCESSMLKEESCQQPELMERCLESYCSSLVTVYEILENGMDFLKGMRAHVTLTIDKMARMEAEGAPPAAPSHKHLSPAGELNRVLRKIDLLIDSLENMSFMNAAPKLVQA